MADINGATLSGRLVRDAELKYTNSGLAIMEFSLANNYSVKRGENWENEVNFFNCTMFGRRAESLQQYMTKGQQVVIEADVRQDRWKNQEGQNRSKINFIVKNVLLAGERKKPESRGYDPAASFGESQGESQYNVNDGGFKDDIPF